MDIDRVEHVVTCRGALTSMEFAMEGAIFS